MNTQTPSLPSSGTATNGYEVYASSGREEMLPFIPEGAKTFLDVGCSVGNFGALLKSRREAEVWGVETNPEAAAFASERLDYVINAPFDTQLDLKSKRFDCVIFNDVLEHMVDPYSALEHTKSLLLPGGHVVASIPNVRYFGNMWPLIVHRSWEYVESGILDRTHLRFFTVDSIRSMFVNLGYTIDQLVGINALEEYDTYFVRKYRILNFLALNRLDDMRWMQFAVVAHTS